MLVAGVGIGIEQWNEGESLSCGIIVNRYVSWVKQQQTVFAFGRGGDDITFKSKPVMAGDLYIPTVSQVYSTFSLDSA